jgi:hypothetical protein
MNKEQFELIELLGLSNNGYFGSFCATDFGVVCATDFGSNCASG